MIHWGERGSLRGSNAGIGPSVRVTKQTFLGVPQTCAGSRGGAARMNPE